MPVKENILHTGRLVAIYQSTKPNKMEGGMGLQFLLLRVPLTALSLIPWKHLNLLQKFISGCWM